MSSLTGTAFIAAFNITAVTWVSRFSFSFVFCFFHISHAAGAEWWMTWGFGLLRWAEPGASLSLSHYIWSDSRRLAGRPSSLISLDSLLSHYVCSLRQLGLTCTDECAQAKWHSARFHAHAVEAGRRPRKVKPSGKSVNINRWVFTVTPLKYLWAGTRLQGWCELFRKHNAKELETAEKNIKMRSKKIFH